MARRIVGVPIGAVIYRWGRLAVGLARRRAASLPQFVEDVSSTVPMREDVAKAVREAIGKSYRLRPDYIHLGDTERSVRPYYGASLVFAFEIAVSVPLLMGKGYLVEDPRVDVLIMRLSTEPRTVADIVRIMNEAYGGVLRKREEIGTPEGGAKRGPIYIREN